MNEDRDASDVVRRLFTARYGSLFFIVFCVGITLISVGITATLALLIDNSLSARLGDLGQIFESVNAAFSGLAFIALVVTFRLQYEELRLQRQELKNQHSVMSESQRQLRRSAEYDIRGRHVELIRMAMEDEDLAEFWPKFAGGISAKRAKQYNYANLVIQRHRLLYETGMFSKDDAEFNLRFLFTSQIMRDYWAASSAARTRIVRKGTSEWSFQTMADAVFREPAPEPYISTTRERELAQDATLTNEAPYRGAADSDTA